MLLPMAEQNILDKKNCDACLHVNGITPLYFNFRSETKKYYFGTEIDETSQGLIMAIPTDKQIKDLNLLEVEFVESSDQHVFTTDYGINLAFRNLYPEKRPSHTIHKQPFNENAVQLHLDINFQSTSIWKKLAQTWMEF